VLALIGMFTLTDIAIAQDDAPDDNDAVTVVEDTNEEEADSALQDAVPEAVENVNYENWEFAVGFLTPFLLSFVMNPLWSSGRKIAILLGFSILTTAIGLFLQDQLDVADWIGSSLKVLSTSIVFYLGIAAPLGLNAKWGVGKVDTGPPPPV
jgi:hypothetical protein